MEPLATRYSAVLLSFLGVATHVFYFANGEHHLRPVAILQFYMLVGIAATFGLSHIDNTSLHAAAPSVGLLALSYFVGLFTSLAVYRFFFHRLNKFPGPWQARLSSLWLSFQVRRLDSYYYIDDLHKKYGQYVRIGSNDLSITDPAIMVPAYGADSKVIKGDWYDGTQPHESLQTTRSRANHDLRRRIWAPAFSDRALRSYEPTVQAFNKKLVKRIRELNGEVVNMTKWFGLYGFDVMGSLAFGRDYGMVESGQRHWAIELMSEGVKIVGIKPPTWLMRFLLAVPGLARGYWKFLYFCADELKWRVNNPEKIPGSDITGWLLRSYESVKKPEEDSMLQGDARLVIVAGSDTTASTLTYLFYHLAADPSQVLKLRAELQALTAGEWTDKDIQTAEHLNAVINETLRLHPPVPSGLHRMTPKEGLQVGDKYIPGGVHFWTPMYSMCRDEHNFEDAASFVPERWYSRPGMIKHREAFAPFSVGPYGCIGKNLARMELRTLTTHLVLNFDVALAPHEDGSRLMNETLDHFTMTLGDLDLVFTPAPA